MKSKQTEMCTLRKSFCSVFSELLGINCNNNMMLISSEKDIHHHHMCIFQWWSQSPRLPPKCDLWLWAILGHGSWVLVLNVVQHGAALLLHLLLSVGNAPTLMCCLMHLLFHFRLQASEVLNEPLDWPPNILMVNRTASCLLWQLFVKPTLEWLI